VEGIGDEAKTVGPHAVEQLHKGKGEVEEEEEEQVPGGWVCQDVSERERIGKEGGNGVQQFGKFYS